MQVLGNNKLSCSYGFCVVFTKAAKLIELCTKFFIDTKCNSNFGNI